MHLYPVYDIINILKISLATGNVTLLARRCDISGLYIMLICKQCEKEFIPKDKYNVNKGYCSSRCALNYYRDNNPEHQRYAGKKAAEVIIKKYRGTGTKTYVKENGRHQHRVVMERVLGRPLEKGEIVHHKDGNKKNNNPDNLEVMTQSEHARLHCVCVIDGCEVMAGIKFKKCKEHR